MTYKDYNIGDWIGLISGAIEDMRELDGNEMRDLVEFLTKQKSVIEDIKSEINLLSDSEQIADRCRECGKEKQGDTVSLDVFKQVVNSMWMNDGWIAVEDRLPKCEQEVLIYAIRKLRWGRSDEIVTQDIITTALYEDGTMREVNSIWRWEDMDFAGWDEEEDCGIIPEGWWEYRHYNPDEVYNNLVDDHIIAWMPLPQPYKADKETE